MNYAAPSIFMLQTTRRRGRRVPLNYHVLANRASYQELGGDYFDRQTVVQHRTRLIRKLEALGLKVTVEELPVAA